MTDLRVVDRTMPGQVVTIPQLPGRWRRIEARYDYEGARTRCPNCGHAYGGVPWHGWFSCGMCSVPAMLAAPGCVALVDTGEAFVPAELFLGEGI